MEFLIFLPHEGGEKIHEPFEDMDAVGFDDGATYKTDCFLFHTALEIKITVIITAFFISHGGGKIFLLRIPVIDADFFQVFSRNRLRYAPAFEITDQGDMLKRLYGFKNKVAFLLFVPGRGIERLNSAFRPAHIAQPAQGVGNVMAVAEPHRKVKELEILVQNVEQKEDARSIGQQSRKNLEGSKSRDEEKKKERDLTRLLLQTLRQNIEEARRILNDLGNLVDLKLEQAITVQALKQKELDEIGESLRAIDNGIERLEKGEAPELDGNGKLKDHALESVVKAWKQ